MKLIAFSVCMVIGVLCMVYSIFYAKMHQTFDYHNDNHLVRLVICIVVEAGLSVLMAFLPVTIWPLPVLVLVVTLLSNQIIGVVCGAVFTMITVLTSGQSVMVFCLYFALCLLVVLVFYGIDVNAKLGLPIFISIVGIVLVETTLVALSRGSNLSFSDFLNPLINVAICLILEALVLAIFCSNEIFKDRDIYLSINDTEYPVLKEAREKNKEVYMHSVHTTYLAGKIADALSVTTPAVKTAAYYYKIGNAFSRNDVEYYETLCKEQKFPKEATALILSLVKRPNRYMSKEEAIVGVADAMISAVTLLFKKDPEIKPDYSQMVRILMDAKIKQHAFDDCNISLMELKKVEKILLKETLYYDFIR